ncbi:tripartite tricarboxylate transporter substrate binding protein [uncultured Pigmentiphaga sp.]|uniref:Bug family tripartite tricarboxylate transporter substrate binding protein n=1 Tax=uncultured Pigmentiphaga sp. TaxID=340361 RepID=UPI0026035321|nr:tripartite tricarboxylate transporter substrate binding protein [uncultured Pigmentiphaga sp.]
MFGRPSLAHLCGFVLLALSSLPAAHTWAQNYPNRPVTLVVPTPPGGTMDTVGRLVAQGMRVPLGQSVIVENVAGASGVIGVGRVARAAPDGYTLIYSSLATHVISPATMKVPYDVVKDFSPVSFISSTPWVIATRANLPVDNMQGLLQWLRNNPGKASMGTAGSGSPSHLGGILLKNKTQTEFELIPYAGNAPVAKDLVSGVVDFAILDPILALPFMRSGHAKILAVLSDKRMTSAPEVPTIDEAGVPGLHIAPWQAIWAPKDTPAPVIKTLNAAVSKALEDPAIRKQLEGQGYEVGSAQERTPEYLARFHQAEIDKWWPLVQAAGAQAKP